MSAILKEDIPSDEIGISKIESITCLTKENKKTRNNKGYLVLFVVTFLLVGGVYSLFRKNDISKEIVIQNSKNSKQDYSNKVKDSDELEVNTVTFSSYYEGSMAGFPISLYIEIDKNRKITGQYKNIRYGTTLPLSGDKGFDGTLNIRAGNESEEVYFTLSRFDDCLKGYGSSGSKRLDVCLYSKSHANSSTTKLASTAMSDRLRILIEDWNERHIIHLPSAASLECLYAPDVLFYGQNLSSKECVKRIIQIMNKYDSFSQRLASDIQYTVLNNDCVRCDFTKCVTVNGSAKNYPAYLVFKKDGDDWNIVVESDKQTDAYFERLRKKR
ncbi:hypothetical protein [Parabacteroides sp.]